MADNPFGALFTPDMLAARRQAELDARYADADLPTQLAASGGAKLSGAFRQMGLLDSKEDRIAAKNQDVMARSQATLESKLAEGVDVDEAQASVLESAIKEFSREGMWQQALSLVAPLQELKAQKLERAKLKAETANLESKPEAKEIDQAIKVAQMEAKREAETARLELAIERAGTQAERMQYQNQLTLMQIDALRQKIADAQNPDKPEKPRTATQQKSLEKVHDTVAAGAETANLMADLREQLVTNPGAATLAGDVATKVSKYTQGSKAFIMGKGYNPDLTKEGTKASRWLRDNVAHEGQRALVIALAYSFARTNDPGGRLSNQDLEQAKAVVAGEGSPQSRVALVDQAFTRLARKVEGDIGTGVDVGVELGPNTAKRWKEAMDRYGTLVKVASPSAPEAGADGWVVLPNGDRVQLVTE